MITNYTKFKRKAILAVLPLTILLGACAEVGSQVQLQAGDGIDPPTSAEMQSMAKEVYLYNVDDRPTNLKVNSLVISNAMMFLPGDKPDYVVCIQWGDVKYDWTYQRVSPRSQLILSNPMDPIRQGYSLICT